MDYRKKYMPRVSVAAMLAARPAAIVGAVRAEGSVNVDDLLKQVNSEVKRISDDVKKIAESALNESKQAGAVSNEVKAAADKLLTQMSALKDASEKLTAKQEELDGRQRDIEQKVAARRDEGRGEVKSLGSFVVGHDDLKAYIARGAKGAVTIDVNAAITSLSTSAGGLIEPQRESEIVRLPRRKMTIRDLLTVGRTGTNLVQFAKQTTRTNNAAVVSETVQKPESNYVWTLAETPVRTVAHWVPISRQAMDDAPQLQTEIDGELRYGLDYAEEVELLNGSGSGQHLSGLITNASAYVPAFVLSGATMIDALRLAKLQASLAEFPSDGFILNPADWARIELTKDGENRYVWANPRALGVPTLWGDPVVETQAIAADKFLAGAFKIAATIYDRMDAEVLFSSEDRDNFVKNMITARAEKRLALAVKRPAALVYGDFGNS